MAEDDHQQFIHEVIELAREQLKQNGMLDFTVLTIMVAIPSTWWSSVQGCLAGI
jgi:hypothetical protein